MKTIGRTMKAAHEAAADRPDTLIKADEVSDIAFVRGASPSLLARRTWNLLIQSAAGDSWHNKMHSIKKRELCAGWHIGPKEISDVLEELQMTLIRRHVASSNGKAARVTTALLSSTIEEEDNDDDSMVYFRFTPELCELLRVSQHYVELEKLVYLAFECKYTHPLYERGVRNVRNRRFSETISLEDLRAVFGVPKGTLPRWDALKRKVVEPAVAEVNHLCPTFTVRWFPIQDKVTKRHNPPVVAVEFWYDRKDESAEAASRKELAGSRVGRKDRRKGSVEKIAAEQAALGKQVMEELKTALPEPVNAPEQHLVRIRFGKAPPKMMRDGLLRAEFRYDDGRGVWIGLRDVLAGDLLEAVQAFGGAID